MRKKPNPGKEPRHPHGTRSAGSAASKQGRQKGTATRGTQHESHQGEQRGDDREDFQEERDVDDRFSIQSYYGRTDAEKKNNRTWFTDVYPTLFFPCLQRRSFPGMPIQLR